MNRRLDCDICGCFGDKIAVYPGLWIVPLVRGTSEAEGVLFVNSYHLPLCEGTPPNLGGEFQGR